jgi:hypothetical protein
MPLVLEIILDFLVFAEDRPPGETLTNVKSLPL